jgi:hypothetical protein
MLLVAILFFASAITSAVFKSILLGAGLSTLNFTIGYSLIKFSANKPDRIFFAALYAGILLRLILGLSLVIITLIFLEINTYGFIFSILFFYVFYLLIEIFYLDLWRKSHIGGK